MSNMLRRSTQLTLLLHLRRRRTFDEEPSVANNMTEHENGRAALASRMFDAITRKLFPENAVARFEEELFKGMDQHMVLGAIADLAARLIVRANEANGGYALCDGGSMVDE